MNKILKSVITVAALGLIIVKSNACFHLWQKSGSASGGADFGHYESGDPNGYDARGCSVWFCSATPRTLRFSAKYMDNMNQWHDMPGCPFTVTNTTGASVGAGEFTPCENVLRIQCDISEITSYGTISRATSVWY